MEAIHISMLAILVAVVANFFIGFLWYTPLFGKIWAKEMGFEITGAPPTSVMIRGLSFSIIGNFLLAFVFAHNIAAWAFVPGAQELSPTANILNASIFTWLGFFVPVDLNSVAWEKKSWKLFAINTGYHFVTVLVAAIALIYLT